MKKGDKLYCINENLNHSPFVKGLEYTILDIRKANSFIGIDIVFFEEHPDYIVGAMYIDEFFATEKRYRKLKLKKINEKSHE